MYETTKFIGFILFFYKKKINKLKKKKIFPFYGRVRACDFEDSIGVYDLDSPAIPAEWSSNSAGHIYSEGPKRCDIVDKRIVCVCVCVISVSFGASGNLMFCLCFEHRFNDNINWPKLVLTFWIAPHTGRNGASLSPKFRWRPKM